MIRNTTSSWGSVARAFHWIIGLTIIGMLAYGWWMNHIPARPDRFFYRSIHADIGYILLVLMVLRIIWRWINPVPAMPADMPRWQRIAAAINHGALYLATFVVIFLGWAHSGARPRMKLPSDVKLSGAWIMRRTPTFSNAGTRAIALSMCGSK